MDERVTGATGDVRAEYEPPTIVDYGSLRDLTAALLLNDVEDGLGKLLNTDGSSGFLP